MMIPAEVTEQEIEAAEKLISQREFDAALALLQEMLMRAHNEQTRMRLLLDVVTCSTWLNRKDVLDKTIAELRRFPDFDVSHNFIVATQASAYIDLGRAREALDLIDTNLKREAIHTDDFVDALYEQLFLKGSSLVRLARYNEALGAFDAAHEIHADGDREIDMLIGRANCFMALSRYSEAYDVASQVLARVDDEWSTLAMQYMAECRMWQTRVPEALELYSAILKRLPSRLVDEERIRKGIANAMTYLERSRPSGKPS